MNNIEELADKIFSLLKGYGLQLKLFDENGAETTDPNSARRFFVTNPNIMVTINEDNNSVEFNKGASVPDEIVKPLQSSIKNLSNKFQMNSSIKVFGKSIEPKHFSYQVKKDPVMENTPVAPVNSHILGKILKELDYAEGMSAQALADNIPGADLNQVQQALNRLVQTGKISSFQHLNQIIYSKTMEEAIYEDENLNELSTNKLSLYKTAAAIDAGRADKEGDFERGNKRFSGIVNATKKQFKNDKESYQGKSEIPEEETPVKAVPEKKFELVDSKTGQVVGRYATMAIARNKRDKKDNEYGAYRYKVRPIEQKNVVDENSPEFVNQFKKSEPVKNQNTRDLWNGKTATKPLNTPVPIQKKKMTPFEEDEHLNELSPKTHANYIKKASNDVYDRMHDAGTHATTSYYRDEPEAGEYYKSAVKHANKADKRLQGIDKATDRLSKQMESLSESLSKMFGSKKTSHQVLENIRIIVKHRTPVDENIRGSRTRQISSIFLECDGIRTRFPNNYLPGARAMAQHMAHGGLIDDKVGSYITENIDNLLKLQSFNKYINTNKLIDEDSSNIIETIKENIETIRNELKKLTGQKTYESVRARIETFERETLAEDDISSLKDIFTVRRFDEKFNEVLPIVKQLVNEKNTYHKRIEESAANIIRINRQHVSSPMFEFASENAKLGFKLSELSLRIMENEELASFVNKIGTKICKESTINDFEKAILQQVFENIKIEDNIGQIRQEIKESYELESFFEKFDKKFY